MPAASLQQNMGLQLHARNASYCRDGVTAGNAQVLIDVAASAVFTHTHNSRVELDENASWGVALWGKIA